MLKITAKNRTEFAFSVQEKSVQKSALCATVYDKFHLSAMI
ncbi:MAG: hypothetical protein ACI4J2_07945 [Ruminococcus sp.]